MNQPDNLIATSKASLLRYATGIAIALAGIAVIAVTFHVFMRVAGKMPYVTVDDALFNIAYSFSNFGRYGFLASPSQVGTDSLRADFFFNHGPWHLYLATLLDWLFGTSITVARLIHPLSLIAVSGLVFVGLGRVSLAAALGFAACLFAVFWYMHWPMFRPDPMVSTFAAATLVSLGIAIRSGGKLAWFSAGFFAVAAVTTHPIAWALVPYLIVMWALDRSLLRGWGSDAWTIMASAFSGGFVSGILYLAAIDFNISANLQLWIYYGTTIGKNDNPTYLGTLKEHWLSFWMPLNVHGSLIITGLRTVMIAGVIVSVTAIAISFYKPLRLPKVDILAITAPPVFLFTFYLASLGFFTNHHGGYMILLHVTALWTAAAGAASGVLIFRAWLPAMVNWLEIAGRGLACSITAIIVVYFMTTPPYNVQNAAMYVDFDDYYDQIESLLPDNASAWGTVQFGMYTGKRIDLVQFTDAVALAKDFEPFARKSIAPEYLILARETQFIFSGEILRNMRSGYSPDALLPNNAYRLHAIVSAPPYGATRIYRKSRPNLDESMPINILTNDGVAREWHRNAGPPLNVEFVSSPPATVTFTLYGHRTPTPAKATSSVRSREDLAPGSYLIETTLTPTKRNQPGVLLASNSLDIEHYQGTLASSTTQAPYFEHETKTALLYRHPGGPLYISQLTIETGTGFADIQIKRIEEADQRDLAVIPPPSIEGWKFFASNGKSSVADRGRLRVDGNSLPNGYQIVSPPIGVPPQTLIEIQLPHVIERGRIAVGVLSADEKRWLAFPREGKAPIKFRSGNYENIRLVVTNAGISSTDPAPRFEIGEPVIYAARKEDYTDTLIACRRSQIAKIHGMETSGIDPSRCRPPARK